MDLLSAVRNREEISHILINLIKRFTKLEYSYTLLVKDEIVNGVVDSAPSQNAVYDALILKANLNSPVFTGIPKVPTASLGDSSTTIASTAFVTAAIGNIPTPPIYDGSETKINAGTNVTVTGNGTILTPYTINSNYVNTTYSAGTGLSLVGTTFNNIAPDQVVTLLGTGATSISGTYPNFTINSTDTNTTYSAGTGLSLTAGVFANTAPDRIVAITGTGGTTVTGTYPNFNVNSPVAVVPDGSETKITSSATTTVTGNGTTATPYQISVPGITNKIINRGWFSGLEVGGMTIGGTLSVSGDIVSATVTANDGPAGYTTIRCVLANAMPNTNYKVDFCIESLGTLNDDARLIREVFKIINTSTFDYAVRESSAGTQALKVHVDVIAL